VRRVELLEDGDADGIGALQRYTWRSRLPYNLVFDMRIDRIVPHELIVGTAISGDLVGSGVWHLSESDSITRMQYNWDVSTTKPWMKLLTPIARPFFAWNHDVVMRWGGEGLAKRLGTPVISEQSANS
jgi:hypothetical protein